MSKVLDAPPAESSTAPTSSPAETTTPSIGERIAALSSEERVKYDLTGDLPDVAEPPAKDKPAADAPAKEEKPAATSEPGAEAQDKEPKDESSRRDRQMAYRDRRIGELSAELRRAQRELEDAKKAKPADATAKTDTEWPDMSKFDGTAGKTLRDYELAVREAARKEAQGLIKTELDQRDTSRTKQENDVRGAQELETLKAGWAERAEPIKKEHADFDQHFKSLAPFLDSVAPAVGDAISRDPQGPRVLMHLAKTAGEIDRILALPPTLQVAEIGKLSYQIEQKLKNAPQPNRVTRAGEPPHQTGGKDERVEGPKVGSKAWFDQENLKDAKRILGEAS